jgi:hypothetical protein
VLQAEQSEKQLQRARAEAAEEARQAAVEVARVKAELDSEREKRRQHADDLEDTRVRCVFKTSGVVEESL